MSLFLLSHIHCIDLDNKVEECICSKQGEQPGIEQQQPATNCIHVLDEEKLVMLENNNTNFYLLDFEMVRESGSCGCVFALLAKNPFLSHNIKMATLVKNE